MSEEIENDSGQVENEEQIMNSKNEDTSKSEINQKEIISTKTKQNLEETNHPKDNNLPREENIQNSNGPINNQLKDHKSRKTSDINIYVTNHDEEQQGSQKKCEENNKEVEDVLADEIRDDIEELKRRINSVVGNQTRRKTPPAFKIDELESVNRIISIPIVETGWHYAESFYQRLKTSNTLFNWTLEQAEISIHSVLDTALPAAILFQGPITTVDKLICKSLDIVEERVPSINLPPEMIYWNTKQYVTEVTTNLARPVLKRADSVKVFGNTVLSSKYTAFAADTLDGALDVADKYVDKYFPAEVYDDNNTEDADSANNVDGPAGKAYHTFHHVDRFSRKLQRRLTKRTLIEAKALKEQSAEAIHVLLYVAELVATDPKEALRQGRELWASLSQDEPENQARPENLEQLMVLLTRETTRRVVHFINFASKVLSTVPRKITNSLLNLTHFTATTADSLVKTVHLEGVQRAFVGVAKFQAKLVTNVLRQLNDYISDVLENMAQQLQSNEQPKSALEVPKFKLQPRATVKNSKQTNISTKPTSNGVDTSS